ncbi:MAG TPA: diiron oxygenase [Acidimicrobiales bacterium]|nr:diiron oxygenase [Acidimicrobiales bacterium]
MVVVDVPGPVSERLNTASARRRWYPFDDDVIDWSIPLTAEWSYMPAGHSVFSESQVLDGLGPDDRSFLERWEITQLMRNVAHGEHLLNQGILAMLWNIDPYDPSYRFLLHEVAEECQHMAMFNQWVRVNDDIETVGAGETGWGKAVADFTEGLAVRLPEAFWVNVLLFEFVGDDFNQAMRNDAEAARGADGRPLHPILVAIGRAHTGEEARHIAYARRWLHEGMPGLDDEQVHEVQTLAEFGAQALIDRKAFLPVRYTPQLEPYLTEEEFTEARGVSPARRAMLKQLKKLLDEFESLRILRPDTMKRWEEALAFD